MPARFYASGPTRRTEQPCWTGGWDGFLHSGSQLTGLPLAAVEAAHKPLSACGWTVDGTRLAVRLHGRHVAASGMSPIEASCSSSWLYTRPISAFSFTPDGQGVATAAWDRQIALRKLSREREGRNLAGHQDIVSGCRYAADARAIRN